MKFILYIFLLLSLTSFYLFSGIFKLNKNNIQNKLRNNSFDLYNKFDIDNGIRILNKIKRIVQIAKK
jgi:hypothetical protein